MPDGAPGASEDGDERHLLSVTVDPFWRDEAACRGYEPALFFPERGDSAGMRWALGVCAGCDVRLSCLAEHILEDDGVFGGTSGRQRRLMRSRMGQTRECRGCASMFVRAHPGQWYCSQVCRKANQRSDP